MSDPATPPDPETPPSEPATAGVTAEEWQSAQADLARYRAAEAKRAREAQLAEAAKRDKMAKDEQLTSDLEATRKELAELKAEREAEVAAAAEEAKKRADKIRKALPKTHPVHMMADAAVVKWHATHGAAEVTTTGTKRPPSDKGPVDYSGMTPSAVGKAFAKEMARIAKEDGVPMSRRAVQRKNPALWDAYMASREPAQA